MGYARASIRADTVRPYGVGFDPDNPVKVIGHDHKFIFKKAV
jgi:hypothetical protein